MSSPDAKQKKQKVPFSNKPQFEEGEDGRDVYEEDGETSGSSFKMISDQQSADRKRKTGSRS